MKQTKGNTIIKIKIKQKIRQEDTPHTPPASDQTRGLKPLDYLKKLVNRTREE